MGRCAFPLLAAAGVLVGCGAPDRIVLGRATPRPYHFGTPTLVAEIASDLGAGNPTLTADLREIYFTRGDPDDPANSRVWSATRDSAAAAFGTPRIITEIVAEGDDQSSAISADGLMLWFGSDRTGGAGELDIWVSTRASRSEAMWSTPLNLTALNSPSLDVPRPLGDHDRVMPLSSDRASPDGYQILFAAARTANGTFDSPTPAAGLSMPGQMTVDGFLTNDGLTIFYTQAAAGSTGDLFVSWRRSTSEAFGWQSPLSELNTGDDERDPWLSPDGTQLYFSSNRSGVLQIYVASVTRGP